MTIDVERTGNGDLDTSGPPDRPGRTRRLTSLDGLRGIAALVVVIYHVLALSPRYGVHPATGSLTWWFDISPLSLLQQGTVAVLVFFVLSGFVLSRPFLSNRGGSWRSYYPRRFFRLYVPVWGAVAVTWALATLAAHWGTVGPGSSLHSPHRDGLAYIGRDLALPHIGDTFDGPLWSLRWEILFSLSLPLYILIAQGVRRSGVGRALLVIGVGALAVLDLKLHSLALRNTVFYMPVFGLGVALSLYEEQLVRIGRRLVASKWMLAALLAMTALFLNGSAEVRALAHTEPSAVATVIHGAEVVGAALLIWLVLSWGPLERGLDRRSVQWVGKRSFSLYLIHMPILMALALALGGHPNRALVMVVALPVALLATAAFYVAVEHPSHRLADMTGRWAARLRFASAPTTRRSGRNAGLPLALSADREPG